jgi:catalase (peroxidase I)
MTIKKARMLARQTKYLEVLASTSSHAEAAKAAGVSESVPFRWRKTDAEFRAKEQEVIAAIAAGER